MTCVCPGLCVRIGDCWHACDLHAVRGDESVWALRVNNSPEGAPFMGRSATINYDCDLSCWFDRHATFSTLIVLRAALQMSEEARVYVQRNTRVDELSCDL